MDINQAVNYYYENDAKRLRDVCKSVLKKINPTISDSDLDDYYELANIIFVKALKSYKPDKSQLQTHIRGCLDKKFRSEMRDRYTDKRFANYSGTRNYDGKSNSIYSIYHKINEETTIADTIASDFNIEDEIGICDREPTYSSKVENYIARLSPLQRKIALLLSNGNDMEEICLILNIEEDIYNRHMKNMRSYEKTQCLF